MPSDPKKRQKKLERRTAKRKDKKHVQVREQTAGLPERLTAATRYPVLHCWIGGALADKGMGQVLLSRSSPNGLVAVATFLVDRFCLGIKDAHAEILPRADYDRKYVDQLKKMSPQPVTQADARKLLEQAVEYARGIGLAPHPDYAKALPLFGPITSAESTMTFEFGKDGKPLFISGPYDTPERCRQIIATLTNTCGPNGFHYLMGIRPDTEIIPIEE